MAFEASVFEKGIAERFHFTSDDISMVFTEGAEK